MCKLRISFVADSTKLLEQKSNSTMTIVKINAIFNLLPQFKTMFYFLTTRLTYKMIPGLPFSSPIVL